MKQLRGFYAVLDRDDEQLARTLLAHAGILQVRLKPRGSARSADAAEIVRVARWARRLCDEHGAALVVNDRVDLALAAGADGVHLGQTDLPLAAARAIAGKLWIGISTHDLAQVRAAVAGGADYLGFGPVFATATKADPDAVQGLSGLAAAVAEARDVPIVAIGGITPANACDVYRAGASCVCAIGSVNDAPDVARAARSLRMAASDIAHDSKV
jgi:thiamine-phosphate diphosphorylase